MCVLNKPKFMKPSTNKEECTIDITADEPILFSCIVDGNEAVTDWQIVVYDILDNSEVFKTDKIHLEPSFYPIDEKNRNVVFSINLKEYLDGNTTFINRTEAYYWTITFWGNSSTVTSYQEVFYANKTPEISFLYKYQTDDDYNSLSDVKTLTSRFCTFKAIYEQEDKVQLKRYGWRITDTNSGQVFIDTISKNQIYGSADNIICNYDGFLNGGNYSVELFIETQNNTKITTSPLFFSVSYISTFLSSDFKVETLKNEPAIMLDWNKAVVISGVLKDADDDIVNVIDTTFKTNYPVDNQCSIEIPNEFKVVYDNKESLNFDIDEDSYIVFSTQLLSKDDAIVFFAEGYDDIGYELKRRLTYTGGSFVYEIVGQNGILKTAIYDVINKPSEYIWYNIFMSPLIESDDGEYTVSLEVFEGKVINCIYPSKSLYPMAEAAWDEAGSKDFYPIFGNWSNLKREA